MSKTTSSVIGYMAEDVTLLVNLVLLIGGRLENINLRFDNLIPMWPCPPQAGLASSFRNLTATYILSRVHANVFVDIWAPGRRPS